MTGGVQATEARVREKIAVALDLDSADAAVAMAARLAGHVGWMKVGLQLFTAAGGPLVRRLTAEGHRLFLDLKLHDIPNTVAAAAVETVGLGAAMINVHASGGLRMMAAAAEALDREARRRRVERPKLIAVTALTSLDEDDLAEIGLLGPADELVVRMAVLALRAGCDGVVCSPREVRAVRERCGEDFVIVTPGIRPAVAPRPGSSDAGTSPRTADDQRRVATPAEALAAGADLIVIGRPITGAEDPAAAADSITREATAALSLADGPVP